MHSKKLINEIEKPNKALSENNTFLRKNAKAKGNANNRNITSYSNMVQNIPKKADHFSVIIKPKQESKSDALT